MDCLSAKVPVLCSCNPIYTFKENIAGTICIRKLICLLNRLYRRRLCQPILCIITIHLVKVNPCNSRNRKCRTFFIRLQCANQRIRILGEKRLIQSAFSKCVILRRPFCLKAFYLSFRRSLLRKGSAWHKRKGHQKCHCT